jgi:hypothetical protein
MDALADDETIVLVMLIQQQQRNSRFFMQQLLSLQEEEALEQQRLRRRQAAIVQYLMMTGSGTVCTMPLSFLMEARVFASSSPRINVLQLADHDALQRFRFTIAELGEIAMR